MMGMGESADGIEKVCQKYARAFLSAKNNVRIFSGFTW
jgi:hypothetical protein